MKKHVLTAACAALFLLAPPAIAEDAAAPATPAATPAAKTVNDYVILKVDGEPVKYSEVEAQWNTFFGGSAAPDFSSFDEKIKQSVLREVMHKKLVYRDAVNQGYERNPEMLKKLEELKRQLIIQSYVEDKTKALLTDENLKMAYEDHVKKMKDVEEIRARHILVASETEAKDMEKRLKDGANFEALAKEKSDDKGSGAQGGDLGYFTKDKMIPEFATAAFALKKGEVSPPVKSEFGWHIIKLEDRRTAPVPTFEQLKPKLQEEVANKELSRILEGLGERARVTYYGPDGKEKPFEKKSKAMDAKAKAEEKKP